MRDDHAIVARLLKHLDDSLTGENSTRAIERELAEDDWNQSPVLPAPTCANESLRCVTNKS